MSLKQLTRMAHNCLTLRLRYSVHAGRRIAAVCVTMQSSKSRLGRNCLVKAGASDLSLRTSYPRGSLEGIPWLATRERPHRSAIGLIMGQVLIVCPALDSGAQSTIARLKPAARAWSQKSWQKLIGYVVSTMAVPIVLPLEALSCLKTNAVF